MHYTIQASGIGLTYRHGPFVHSDVFVHSSIYDPTVHLFNLTNDLLRMKINVSPEHIDEDNTAGEDLCCCDAFCYHSHIRLKYIYMRMASYSTR
jgi:hypothetical protein